MPRLLIVSNRLPVTLKPSSDDGEAGVTVEPSSGGLATGMKGPHERLGGLWIGWPGELEGLSERARSRVDRRLDELKLAAVPLTRDEIARYYEGYSNAVLWPLFHYALARLPMVVGEYEAYEAVNRKFADAVAARYQPGDLVWVHDYQLMLVPALLRARIPDARIGFFLHIPFPSSELFRIVPHREELLEGLLGADVIGFHTATFVRHFVSSALRIVGASTDVDRIRWRGRDVRVGVFPMGVDARHWSDLGASDEVVALAREHRDGSCPPGQHGVTQLLVGIDRLDYTKGIPRRLLAFEQLLRDHPELRGRVRLVQVAVPSRENVGAYAEFRAEVDAVVGRIHGEFATPAWSPIHYLYRGLTQREIAGLYRGADAVLVTPLRDGMNLVAKEFVAARPDCDGVLVLSEFAGAAAELSEALLVNPYDIAATAEAFHRALTMPEDERRARMSVLRDRVMRSDVHVWARTFIARLEAAPQVEDDRRLTSSEGLDAAALRARRAERLVLFLDYDGTLVPFARTPELAAPDAELLRLLERLAARERTEVHVVSGRKRETLDRWLGRVAVALHAEHGLWSRPVGGEWHAAELPPAPWREGVLRILREFSERTPGSLVEEKTAGLAWHYRAADPEYGELQAKELSLHLSTLLSNVPVELLPGDKVLEVRPHGIHKGRIVTEVLAGAPPGALALAIGDDRTDEDLFAALPEGGIAVHVGPAPSRAALRVADVAAARAFLARIAG